MPAINTSKSSIGPLQSNFPQTRINISKKVQFLGRKITSIKNEAGKAVIDTAKKIKIFIQTNFKNIFFMVLSAFALIHGPYRFLLAAMLGFAIQKVNYKPHEEIVTSSSIALNILAILGIILEKTICPICDPTYYLAPCISGITSAEAFYNFLQSC